MQDYYSLTECLHKNELLSKHNQYMGSLGSSVGKESICNAGDPSSIPRSGCSPGERIGYPLQCSWASLVAQMGKILPAVQETWFRSLDWEDPLEEGMATHFSILAQQSPWTEEPGGPQSMGLQRVRHDWTTKHSTTSIQRRSNQDHTQYAIFSKGDVQLTLKEKQRDRHKALHFSSSGYFNMEI